MTAEEMFEHLDAIIGAGKEIDRTSDAYLKTDDPKDQIAYVNANAVMARTAMPFVGPEVATLLEFAAERFKIAIERVAHEQSDAEVDAYQAAKTNFEVRVHEFEAKKVAVFKILHRDHPDLFGE